MNKGDIVKDLFFPRRCAVCDEVLPFGMKFVGNDCAKKLVYIKEPRCLKCGKTITDTNREYCGDCENRKHYFERGMAALDYSCVSDSLYRFKNKGRPEYAEFYAFVIYETAKDFLFSIHPDAFIPVPVHKSKMSVRGYNQSELISKRLSKLTNIPTLSDVVLRKKKTPPLKDLSLFERQNNLKKAFIIGRNDVKLKTIVIIDDIYTTGSTIDEISRTLLSEFDCKIYFLTVTIGRGV